MMPVATPPNALVFGSKYLEISDMISCGVWLNLMSIPLIAMLMYYLLPLLWNL
jgi:sodium-dependent dicarboxylate transporter 2/3/5